MGGMTKAVDALCLKFALVTGATANTAITVTGIATEDTIVACYEGDNDLDRTSTTTITAANVIKCTVTTSGDRLHVWYHDASA